MNGSSFVEYVKQPPYVRPPACQPLPGGAASKRPRGTSAAALMPTILSTLQRIAQIRGEYKITILALKSEEDTLDGHWSGHGRSSTNTVGGVSEEPLNVVDYLNQNDSNASWVADRRHRRLLRIHSSLEPDLFRRFTPLADHEQSSLARIVKVAVVEFLDRHEISATANRDMRANKRGAGDHGD